MPFKQNTVSQWVPFKLFLLIGFWLIGLGGFAQNPRPKIGLVLSGGGAKGIAHIGVLKAMEEAGLTPDYITGTSMGSIVGGLYAAGYSADELKQLIETVDWGMLLSNKVPFNQVTFEEKSYYGRYLFDFYVKNKEIQLPKGIIDGESLIQLFSNLTRPVHGITDFNKLPIPFACIGADITTGQPVVLNKGSLAMSMRASMSIPSIFTPVKIDNHLLVDGGLVHNMPVREVIDMGADIIIGVFVGTNLAPEEELNSAVSILTQSAFITSAFDAKEELAKCNILILPNLEGYSTASFKNAVGILERGTEAGEAYLEVFKKLADSLNQLGPSRKVIKPTIETEYVFEEVQVEGNQVIDKDFIIGKMQVNTGEKVSIDHIEQRLQLIYGTQYFEKLWFEILGTKEHQLLKIHVTERPRAQLRFSYHYDSENKGGIVANATLRNVLLNRSRLIVEADLATFPRATLDYFKYVGKNQNVAVEATGIYLKNELPAYDSLGNLNSLFSSNYVSAGLRLQTTVTQNGAFGVEANLNQLILTPKIADNLRIFSRIDYRNTTFSVYHRFDNTNDRYFPTRGFKSEFKLTATTGINGHIRIGDVTAGLDELGDVFQTSTIKAMNLIVYPIIPVSPKISLLMKARLRLSNLRENTFNLTDADYVGGFIPTWINSNEYYGAGTKQYILANYLYGRLGLQYRMKENIYLQGHFNYLNSDVSWIYPNADLSKLGNRTMRFGYGATAGINSPIGPISLSVAKDNFSEGWRATLAVGFYY